MLTADFQTKEIHHFIIEAIRHSSKNCDVVIFCMEIRNVIIESGVPRYLSVTLTVYSFGKTVELI